MTETALRQQATTYVEQLDSDKLNIALVYLKDLAENKTELTNSKTESERIEATNALAELDQIRLHLKPNPADDDKKTIANAIWKKYESLD